MKLLVWQVEQRGDIWVTCDSGCVSMGSMGSAEPMDFQKGVPEPMDFEKNFM